MLTSFIMKDLILLLAFVSPVHSRTTYDLAKESRPGQFIKQTTILGHRLPQNATKLQVCFKSAPEMETCDVFNSIASFSVYQQKAPRGLIRIFQDEIGKAKKNIFNTQQIIATLKNETFDDVLTHRFSSTWIRLRVRRGEIVLGVINDTHPNAGALQKFLEAYHEYEVSRDDSKVRDLLIVALKLEIFCLTGYFGEDCTEHCPQGCAHGICSNGTCSDCVFPYHGEACDRCGINGDCVNGNCKMTGNDPNTALNAGRCDCELPFEGEQCETLINNCSIVPCSPHGKCNLETFKCTCFDTRFTGNFCEIYSYWGSNHSIVDGTMIIILIIFLVAGGIRIKLFFMRTSCQDVMVELHDKFIPSEKPEVDYTNNSITRWLCMAWPTVRRRISDFFHQFLRHRPVVHLQEAQ